MNEPRTARILLVEDNHADVVIIREALKQSGIAFDLRVAGDGESAMEEIERNPPDLMLLDLNLPKISGLEILERVRRDGPLQRLAVIVVTSSDSPRDLAAIEALGADAYFRKPTALAEYMKLGAVIRRMLARS